MSKSYRYKKKDSERSGFTHLERTLISDKGHLVSADEYDAPPPSNKSLGGEGDISLGNVNPNYTDYLTPAETRETQYLNGTNAIYFKEEYYKDDIPLNRAWIYISGSNSDVSVAKNPQITAGGSGSFLTLECVGSSVLLIDGSGLTLRKSFNMDSGAILDLYYVYSDSTWHETSRSHRTKSLGEF